jgi:signal transduction histidine kinase
MVAAVKHRGRKRGSLTRRAIAVCALVSLVIGLAFVLLAQSVDDLSDSEAGASHALQVLIAANRLERLLIDVETTERGFVITSSPEFLPAWYQAQDEFTRQAAVLERLAREGTPGQAQRAQQIVAAGNSYIRNYSIPVVAATQRDPASARTLEVTMQGKSKVDAIRDSFEQFMNDENQIYAAGQQSANVASSQAFEAASVSVIASIVLIVLSGGYLIRSVVRPVRQVSAMASRVAGGDLTVRMPESGPGEVGGLEQSFNSMAGSLEANKEERRRAASELAASRARVVTAADESRRRIERDLHDGTQQRLISLALQVRAAQASLPPDQDSLAEQWATISDGLTEVIDELREVSRGLHPAILERGGLGPALRALARRAAIPVEVSVDANGRLPEQVEVTIYYVVSEALTNAAKHAHASVVHVDVHVDDGVARLLVSDDGEGGAVFSRGSGLIGLSDRVGAASGRLEIISPPAGGTTLSATIPVRSAGQALAAAGLPESLRFVESPRNEAPALGPQHKAAVYTAAADGSRLACGWGASQEGSRCESGTAPQR